MVRDYRNNTVDEIKSRCNIVDVIGRAVPLKKAGRNYKGLCPFHNEKTPSFVVSEDKQIFTCFGCGAKGDVIAFVEKYYNLDFIGAVEMLAKEYGIEITGNFGSNKDNEELYEINRIAARFFYRALRERANPGYDYMKSRGITEETMNEFGIGYADGQWESLFDHMKAQNIDPVKLERLGLITSSKGKYYDKFRDRVIFPIINTRGKVIGFGGRIIGEGMPKYLNSPESAVFLKKNNLYGLNLSKGEASKKDRLILVEGYMDVIALYQAGIRNVAASLGTALTQQQAALIKRYTKNVVLSYDADEAGQEAAMRGIDILYAEDCRARVLKVTDGKDPDDFIKSKGKKAFLELADNALPYGDFKIDRLLIRYDIEDEQQRIDFLREMIGILKSMKPVEADLYIQKISDLTGISQRAIRMEYQSAGQTAAPVFSRIETELTDSMTEEEKTLARLMMLRSGYADIPHDVRELTFQTERGQKVLKILTDQLQKPHPLTASSLRDQADPEVYESLCEIERINIPEDKEGQAFEDCIAFVRRKELERRDQEITWQLSLADETIDDDKLAGLMKEQAEIQKKLKG